MPYNSSTSAYERRAATVIDATPDGDTVAVAIDVKLDQGIDDYVTDLNHHNVNGNHYPETSVGSDSRFLKQSPAGAVSWANGVVAADAALKDFSNVASGAISNDKLAAIAPSKITQNASNRFVTDAEKSTWNGALYDKADVEGVLTGTITSHTHSAASESAVGLVELATTAEAAAGTDTSRAVTAAGVDAYHKANNINLGVSYTIVGNETAIDFGSDEDPIPAGVKRVTVMFDGVSTNGVSDKIIQLGTSSGIETSGYLGGCSCLTAAGTTRATFSTGFALRSVLAADVLRGKMFIDTIGSSNTFNEIGLFGGITDATYHSAGGKTLSGPLDRIRITAINGVDKFDAGGIINISWEF